VARRDDGGRHVIGLEAAPRRGGPTVDAPTWPESVAKARKIELLTVADGAAREAGAVRTRRKRAAAARNRFYTIPQSKRYYR